MSDKDHRNWITEENKDRKCPSCGRIVTERYGENPPSECVWCRNGYTDA